MDESRAVPGGTVDFGKVLETTPTRIFVWDADGNFLFANGDAARLLGLAPADIVGAKLAELGGRHELLHAIIRPLEHVVATGTPSAGEARVAADGLPAAVLHYDLRPLELGGGAVSAVLGTITDITDLRSAQESERRVRRQLQDALTRVLSGFVRICSECYAVCSNGEWTPLDRYLEQSDAASLSHGYCEACYQRALAELTPAR